jgi:hypothetical protein
VKRCPKHYWFEYDQTQGGCQLCEREALKAQHAAVAAAPPPPLPDPNVQAPASWPPAPSPAPAARVEQPEEPRMTPPAPASSYPAEPYRVPDPLPHLQPQEPLGQAQPAFQPRETADDAAVIAPPSPPEPLDDEDSRILRRLTHLRENGVFTVVVIGFYAGGKTWFLNRIMHELGRWGFNISPPPARDRERVTRTVNLEIHHARRLSDNEVRGFALVDIPGERLTRLVAKDFRSVKSVIAAMDMCGALIVALPADEVLLSEDVHREAQELGGIDRVLLKRTADDPQLHRLAQIAHQMVLEAGSVEDAIGRIGPKSAETQRIRDLGEDKSEDDRQRVLRLAEETEALDMLTRAYRLAEADAELSLFTQDLCFMTGLMSKLRQEGRPVDASYDFGRLQAGDVDTHISSRDYARFLRPTYVAMTKADLVSHPDPLLKALIKHSRKPDIGIAFDEDPLDSVREMRQSLAAMFEQWFANSKFDFVTAFHQHHQSDIIDYSKGHFGVTAVFDWISWAQRWDEQRRGERDALARARTLRRSRDGRQDPARDWEFMQRKMARG